MTGGELTGMSILGLIQLTAESIAYDEDPQPADDFGGLEAHELDAVLTELARYGQAVRMLRDHARSRVAEIVGKGYIRFQDRTYKVAPERTIKVRKEAEADFYRFVQDKDMVRRCFPAYSVRQGAWSDLADLYVDEETGEVGWDAFVDRFLHVETGEVAVSEMPTHKAPQYVQKAPDGQVVSR